LATTDYLKRRGQTWFVRVQIPQHLWKAAGGKREYVKTLKTGDLSEANRRKHPYIAAFKQRITALERQKGAAQAPAELVDLYEKALALRETMQKYEGKVLHYEGGNPDMPYYATDEFLGQISDEAKDLADEYGDKVATAFYKIAKGEGTLLTSQVDTWLAEQGATITAQTSAQHRTVIRAFADWAGSGVLIEDVTQRYAGQFVSRLLSPASGLSRKTARRYVSSLSSFWRWLRARGLATENPWREQDLGKKSTRGETPKRRQWTDEALAKVLSGAYTPRYTATLHDLVRLALVTGARLDELCALKTSDTQKRGDGWWITIEEGKTEAARREVPIHDSAAHVVERRSKASSNFLFEKLVPGGPDKKRSWNVSKAFGHYTQKLDLGDNRQTFHSLRNTFVEVMEAAEVPESTIKLIIGHARPSLTFGGYSKGKRVRLREVINKLRYSADVMRLIRKPTQEEEKRTTTRRKLPERAAKNSKNADRSRSNLKTQTPHGRR
jgi:integrase